MHTDRITPLPWSDVLAKGQELVAAVAAYRLTHDVYGDGSREAGRAWDLMRRAERNMERALTSARQQMEEK